MSRLKRGPCEDRAAAFRQCLERESDFRSPEFSQLPSSDAESPVCSWLDLAAKSARATRANQHYLATVLHYPCALTLRNPPITFDWLGKFYCPRGNCLRSTIILWARHEGGHSGDRPGGVDCRYLALRAGLRRA